jgi:hypothetical protein
MIRYGLPVAVAALLLGAPAAVQAQMTQPMAPAHANYTNANATITGQPQPGPDEYIAPGYAQPVPYMMPGVSPRTTWIPGHYDWDPNRGNYVYIQGQYVEAPRENAQWIPGHWVQTPTAWIWIEGNWN